MKAKIKYTAPEVQVVELKMGKRVLNMGSPDAELETYGDSVTI